MKKKILKKLILNKEDIMNLSSEDANSIRGGNLAPTYVDPQHGGYCTDTCGCLDTIPCTDGAGVCPESEHPCNFTTDCTAGTCVSVRETGCDNTMSVIGTCFTNRFCTHGYCTNTCPTTYGDATCGCK